MKFSVDAHAIGRHLTGNEVYVRSLLNGFAEQDRQSEFVAYISTEEARTWVPERIITRSVSPNPFVRLGFELSRRLREDRPDLIHVQYTAPLACPVPIVVSVHDVSFLECPEYFPKARAMQLQMTVKRTVGQAARILTGSHFSKRTICKAYGVNPDSVVVVPNAAGPYFRPLHLDNALDRARTGFNLPAPFVLAVGDVQPRKNPIGLIKAFAKLVNSVPGFRHRLALAGQETWFTPRVKDLIRELGMTDRIRLLGFVSDDDLLHLYNACELFVFPSYYEGFGLPVLEAMACGRAVACTNTTAVPEVADGAAILFDSEEDIARAMLDLIRDSDLRIRMERLGQQRHAQFSWGATASRTLDVYYEVAGALRHQAERARTRPAIPSR